MLENVNGGENAIPVERPSNGFKKPFPPKKPAFEVDSTIRVSLNIDLATELGEFIVNCLPKSVPTGVTPNPALMALGFQLKKLLEEDVDDEARS